MASSFTNAHSHIFTANDAPDYFLKTAIPNAWVAKTVDKILQKAGTRWTIKWAMQLFAFLSPNKRDIIRRYLEFIEIGTSATQTDIFDQLNRSYLQFQGHKIIVLTQVLDYLDLEDTSSTHIRIAGQVEEVREIKRNALYRNNIFPFLGTDPRQELPDLLGGWIKKYICPDAGFYGIKIYPAAGFFPFDPRLDPIWVWAEEKQVPIMTHSTRSGSFYLGSFDSILNSGILKPSQALVEAGPGQAILARITNRVNKVIADKSIQKKNAIWCNVFGFPDNYELMLLKHPNLKICLAHLGGASEVNRSTNPGGKSPYPAYMDENWYDMIIDLMTRYKNVYSDISYTLSDADALATIVERFSRPELKDIFGTPLIDKLLYGTDFYLTQQETRGDEPDLQSAFLKAFPQSAQIQALAYDNPARYLHSAIWPATPAPPPPPTPPTP